MYHTGVAWEAAIRPLSLVFLALLVPVVAQAGSSVAPVAPVLGDGKTTATVQILSDDPTARFKVKADKGKIVGVTPVPGGAVVEFLPPAVTERSAIGFSVQVRGQASEDLTANVDVVPPFSGGFDVTADPPIVAAGQTASIKIRPTSKTPQPDERRRIKISVSQGTVSDAIPAADGSWVARYTPPAAKDPQVIAIGVVDAAAPFDIAGQGVIGVSVTRSVTFDAPADSNNVLSVNGREYGPTKASPAGKVSFTVPLSPGQRKATLSSVAGDGTRKDSSVEMPFPTAGGLAIGALPDRAPGGSKVPVLLFCRNADMTPCAGHSAGANTLTGTLEPTSLVTLGLERTTWTLPTSGAASITWTMDQQRATATVTTTAPLATVSLAADPAAVPPGKKDFAIIARVKDPKGTAVIGRPPDVVATGATATGKPKDNGDGSYTIGFRLTGSEAFVRGAPAALAATGLPAQRLVAWADRPAVYADGIGKVDIVVVAEDALGMPVPNVDLTVGVPLGDGSLAPTAKTGPDGAARLQYRVGSKAGAVGIVIEGQGLKTAASLWQAAPGQGAPDVRIAGPGGYAASVDRWRQTLPSIAVRVAAAPVAAPVAAAGAPAVAAPAPVNTAPPTMAAPAANAVSVDSGNPDAPARVPKAPKTPSGSSDRPWARVRGKILDAPQRYRSYAVEGTGEVDPYAPEAAFALSPLFGGLGFGIGAEAWKDRIGGDFGLSLVGYRLAVAEEQPLHVDLDVHLGGRFKVWESGDANAYAGLAFMRSAGVLFEYPDETKATANPVDRNLLGGRLSGGLQLEKEGLLVRAELSELFAPAPVYTRLDTVFDIPVGGPMAFDAGIGLFARHIGFTSESGGKMRIGAVGMEVGIGASYLAF